MAWTIRSHAKIPSKFSGNNQHENAISHWQQWEDYVRVCNFQAPAQAGNADDRVVNFCLSLTDSAREWFGTLDPAITYAQLGTQFKARFGRLPPVEVDILQLSAAQKLPGETYQELGDRILKKAVRVGMEDQALLFYKKAVEPSVGLHIMARNCQNVREAIAAAESIDGYLKTATPAAQAASPPEVNFQLQQVKTNEKTVETLASCIKTMQCMQDDFQESLSNMQDDFHESLCFIQKRSTDSNRSTDSSRSRSRPRTKFRTKTQVKAPETEAKPSKFRVRGVAQKEDECFVCKKKGHWARDCRVLKQVRAMVVDSEESGEDPGSDEEQQDP